jgi:hypothetical protein
VTAVCVRSVEKRSRYLGSQSCYLLAEAGTRAASWQICSSNCLVREHVSHGLLPLFHNLPVSEERRELVAGFCNTHGTDPRPVAVGVLRFGDRSFRVLPEIVGHKE